MKYYLKFAVSNLKFKKIVFSDSKPQTFLNKRYEKIYFYYNHVINI